MPNCSAINCKNTNPKFKLFKFPSNTKLCKRWVINSRRNFIPTVNSRLCEKHFEINQFEKQRTDKKLIFNAIPTLFDVSNPPKKLQIKRINPLRKRAIEEIANVEIPKRLKQMPKIERKIQYSEHNYACNKTNNNKKQKIVNSILKEHLYAKCIQTIENCDIEDNTRNIEFNSSNEQSIFCRCKTYQLRIKKLNKQIKDLKHQISLLQDNISFVNIDQKEYLCRKKKGMTNCGIKWTHDTIQKSLKVRYITGKRGYEYLRKTGYPLPAYRTLCNHLKTVYNNSKMPIETD